MRAMRPVVTLTARKRVSCAVITSVAIVARRLGASRVARASMSSGEIGAVGSGQVFFRVDEDATKMDEFDAFVQVNALP